MRFDRTTLTLALVCAFQAGLLLGQILPDAQAQDGAETAQEAPADDWTPPRPRLLCKAFELDPRETMSIETSDRSTPIGAWVAEKEDGGWQLYMLDLDFAQKTTGFPQGWVNVCMSPA